MNLLCAEGLPGAERLDIAASLAVVEQMAARVQMETARHRYRFEQQPGEFENSEGFFRMMMLMVVLAEDFKVHYAQDKMASAAQARSGDGFTDISPAAVSRQRSFSSARVCARS